MEKTKFFLNVAIGISIIICSFSLLIFSIKGNTANAQSASRNDYQAVGVLGAGIDKYVVVGYNYKTGDTKIIANSKY
jgi:hypothetical protein